MTLRESIYKQFQAVLLSTIKFITHRVALFLALIGVVLATDVKAQSVSSHTQLFFNVAGHYSKLSHEFHDIGPAIRLYSSAEEFGALFSISPTWWIGHATAIELECGYWASAVNSEMNGAEQTISSNEWFVMPHILLTLGTVDSVFYPYAKVGVGLFTGDQDGIPIGWSAGLGAFLPLNSVLSVKAEISYKLKSSSSGRNVIVKDNWQGIFLSAGLGFGI